MWCGRAMIGMRRCLQCLECGCKVRYVQMSPDVVLECQECDLVVVEPWSTWQWGSHYITTISVILEILDQMVTSYAEISLHRHNADCLVFLRSRLSNNKLTLDDIIHQTLRPPAEHCRQPTGLVNRSTSSLAYAKLLLFIGFLFIFSRNSQL